MGGAGALLVSAGAVISMIGGNIMGNLLAVSRILFALADNGSLPRFFGVIHLRYGTPSNAIIFTAIVALGLALWGSFTVLAVASAIARLVTYISVCGATIRLRHQFFRAAVQPATFVIPFGRARATTRNSRVVADARRSHPPTVDWRCGRALGGCGTVYCE